MAPHGLANIDDNPAIQEFHNVLEGFTMHAACGRPYIRVGELTKWLRSKCPNDAKTRIEHLLKWTYLLGYEEHIEHFQGHGIYDRNLPVELSTLQNCLSTLPNSQDVAYKFHKKQWGFCPVKLELCLERNFQQEYILPFKKEKITDKGGTATLWQIEVLEEFVGRNLRDRMKEARYESKSDNLGWRYQFALKSFEQSQSQNYYQEKQAFDGLQSNKGMVRSLANYTYVSSPRYDRGQTGERQQRNESSYNILLEFGDLDLDDYFKMRHPPVLRPEVKALWNDIFEVGSTVRDIHNLKPGDGEEFYGWHADIKPDNILSIQGKFKLADPGFALFVKKNSSEEFPMGKIRGGTETYGAPEMKRHSSHAVSQSIDIWSLGCVFSLVATWVVLGYQGICEFNKVRERAIRRIFDDEQYSGAHQSRGSHDDPVLGLGLGDRFHNGYHVLPEVTSWHEYLRSAVRKSDHITCRVLDLVDKSMLCPHPIDRLSAVGLCETLKHLSEEDIGNPDESPLNLPTIIKETLLDFDNDADSLLAPPASIKRPGKSNIYVPPRLKTTHRSGLLNNDLDRNLTLSTNPSTVFSLSQHINDLNSSENFDAGIDTSPKSKHTSTRISQTDPVSFFTTKQPTPRTPLSRVPQKTSANIPTENVWQAREKIQEREAGNWRNITRKDSLLNRYFVNRDLMFLVDNADSMRPHWFEAAYLLETLVLKASGQDENGMDLVFMRGSIRLNNQKKAKKFRETMSHPEAVPATGVNTDIRTPLGIIFRSYLEELEKSKKFAHKAQVKNLTIIVLTDGKWLGISEREQHSSLNRQIADFVTQVKRLTSGVSERPVSIEFVQFGNDPEASRRLRGLDNNLTGTEVNDDIPDVIDTELSSGNVNKMLLGSFVDEFDNGDYEDEDDITITQSPQGYSDMGSESRLSMHSTSPIPQSPKPSVPTISTYGAPSRVQT